MKVEELMVGDYVHVKPSGMLIRVAAVHRKKVAYHACVSKLAWVRGDLLESIPLTPEILEKNEFEDIGDDIYQLEEKPCWFLVDFFRHNYGCEYDTSTYEYEDDEHRLNLYGIPSVHQLQHALRLCGIDKTIEL